MSRARNEPGVYYKVQSPLWSYFAVLVFIAIGVAMVRYPDVPIIRHPSEGALLVVRLVGLGGGAFFVFILLVKMRWALVATPVLDLRDPAELRLCSALLGVPRRLRWSEVVSVMCVLMATGDALEIRTLASARPVRIFPENVGESCQDLMEELESVRNVRGL